MLKKLFLFFICSFMLFSFNEAKATSTTQENGLMKGFSKMKDRVRKFNQFDYKYNEEQGFSCKPQSVRGTIAVMKNPEGIKSIPSAEIEKASEDDDGDISSKIDKYSNGDNSDGGVISLAIFAEVVDIAITPFVCKGLLQALFSGFRTLKPGDKGYKSDPKKETDNIYFSKGTMIGNFIGFAILELVNKILGTLVNEFIGGNDYALDMKNLYCMPMSKALLSSCITFMLVSTAIGINHPATWSVYGILLISYGLAKLLFVAPQEVRAIKTFERVSICGDEWFTYGNYDLLKIDYETDELAVNQKGDYELKDGVLNANNLTATALDYYPIKTDALPGSYKFHLYKCLKEKNFPYCKKLCDYNEQELNDSNISFCKRIGKGEITEQNYSSKELYMNDKFYREWLYGGMEIKFEHIDYNQDLANEYSNCVDPRSSAAAYDTNIGRFGADINVLDNVYKVNRRQLYYASGTDGVNFACDRWQNNPEYKAAFECCVTASQRFICLNYRNKNANNVRLKNEYTFCDAVNNTDKDKVADCRILADTDVVYKPIIAVGSMAQDSIESREMRVLLEHIPGGQCNFQSISSDKLYSNSKNAENNGLSKACKQDSNIQVVGSIKCDEVKDSWYTTEKFFTEKNVAKYSRINRNVDTLTLAFRKKNITVAKQVHLSGIANIPLMNAIMDDFNEDTGEENCDSENWTEKNKSKLTARCKLYYDAKNDVTAIEKIKMLDLLKNCPDTVGDMKSSNNCYCFSKYKALDSSKNDETLLNSIKTQVLKDNKKTAWTKKTSFNDEHLTKLKNLSNYTIDGVNYVDYECSDKFTTCSDRLHKNYTNELIKQLIGSDIGYAADGVSIPLKVYPSDTNGDSMYCVRTWSMCPYDFNILGGTEIPGNAFNQEIKKKNRREVVIGTTDPYDPTKISDGNVCISRNLGGNNKESDGSTDEVKSCYGKASNYCQLYRHCAYLRPHNLRPDYTATSPYIDKSCINGVGNTKYSESFERYTAYEPVKDIRFNLSSPMVECFTETLRNMLLNKAGHTRCKEANEKPKISLNGNKIEESCTSGTEYLIGEYLDETDYENKLHSLIRKFKTLVKTLLALSIMLFGFKVVVMGEEVKPEKLVQLMFKLIFVVSFGLSTWWVQPIISSVFKITNSVITSTLNFVAIPDITPSYDNPKFDGCYFASNITVINADIIAQKIPMPAFYEYPQGREYLALFDMMDCKIKRYLGFTENSGVTIIIIAILIMFTGGILIIILFPLIFILVTIIINVLKIVYLFIMALMILSILLFFAPMMIPLILFDKTKGIFDSWLKEVIGFIFFPMFLVFATVIMFYIFDIFYVGDAFFVGVNNGPNRTMYCGSFCKQYTSENELQNVLMTANGSSSCKIQLQGEFITLKNTNLMCLLNSPLQTSPVQNNFIQFFVQNTNFQMLNPHVISKTWRILFSDGLILLMILLFLDKILDGVVQLGQAIFNVSVNAGDFPSVKDIMGKVMSYAGKTLLNNPAMNLAKAGISASAVGISKLAHRNDLKGIQEEDNKGKSEKSGADVQINDSSGKDVDFKCDK